MRREVLDPLPSLSPAVIDHRSQNADGSTHCTGTVVLEPGQQSTMVAVDAMNIATDAYADVFQAVVIVVQRGPDIDLWTQISVKWAVNVCLTRSGV